MAKAAKKASGNLTHDNTTNTLTDDQRHALFFQHKRKIAVLKEHIASLTGEMRSAYKIAKAEGYPKKDFDFAFMLEKDKDGEAIERRRREVEIALWLGHPVGTQADLFESTTIDKRPIAETAYEEGKRAGMNNEVLKPPHGAGTEAYERYVAGWHDGSAIKASLKKEQEDGATLLRMNEEPQAVDEFDDAADGADLNGDTSEPMGYGEDWPDDRDVAAKGNRESAPSL